MADIFPSDIRVAAGGMMLERFGVPVIRRATPTRGGEELLESFGRASIGAYRDKDGQLRYAANNIPRPDYWDLDGDNVHETCLWLMEPASTNLAPNSEALNSWTKSGNATVTSAFCTLGGLTLDLCIDADAANISKLTQGFTCTGDGNKAWSFFIGVGSSPPPTNTLFKWNDSTAGNAARAGGTITFAGGVPTVTMSLGGTLLSVKYWGLASNGTKIYRVVIRATGVVAANVNTVELWPAGNNPVTDTGNIIYGGNQVEDRDTSTSYIKTTAGTAARSAESPTVGLGFNPISLGVSIYTRFVELGSGLIAVDGPRVLRASGSGVSNIFVDVTGGGSRYGARSNPPGGGENGAEAILSAAMQTAWGDVVELNARMYTDGRTDIQGAKNGGAVETTTKGNLPTGGPGSGAWTSLELSGQGGGLLAQQAVHVMSVATGVRELTEWRRYWGLA